MRPKYLPILSFFTLGLLIQPIAVHAKTLNYNYSTASLFAQSLLISQFRPGDSCEANDNLSLLADTFISVCRKASIRREFPGEFLNSYLEDIKSNKSATGKKAWGASHFCKNTPALANGIRAPVASSLLTRPTHWLGYTDKTHLRGFQIL
jgi:hypothetical protein